MACTAAAGAWVSEREDTTLVCPMEQVPVGPPTVGPLGTGTAGRTGSRALGWRLGTMPAVTKRTAPGSLPAAKGGA
ncbi:hypothetical protein GCM10023166_12600 [Paeniglutamicibacter cryotolerans]